jgi:hypothetical protein
MAMATRLLSLLTIIENVLRNEGAFALDGPIERTVNFHKGLARMNLSGKGAVALQSYTLADGQICVKALLSWTGSAETGATSIYPDDGFDWFGAAQKIAQIWIGGPSSNKVQMGSGELPAAGQGAEAPLEASA